MSCIFSLKFGEEGGGVLSEWLSSGKQPNSQLNLAPVSCSNLIAGLEDVP